MDTLNGVVAQFNVASSHYAAAIQPFALKLFIGLLFLDILVTALQFGLDQGDAAHYLGRLFKHVLSGGFIYLMIINAFPWMGYVLQSFSRVGTSVSGMPHLDPGTVLQVGGNMAQTIFDSPASASLMPNIELAIVESVSAFIVLLSFVIAAAALCLTIVRDCCGGPHTHADRIVPRDRRRSSAAWFWRITLDRLDRRRLLRLRNSSRNSAAILLSRARHWNPDRDTVASSNSRSLQSCLYRPPVVRDLWIAAKIHHDNSVLERGARSRDAESDRNVDRFLAQIGNGSGDTNGAATGWVKSMDFGRQTQQLANLGSGGGQRVQVPKDVRGTSIMPSRAPNTTPINPGTARYGNGDGTTTVGKATSKT